MKHMSPQSELLQDSMAGLGARQKVLSPKWFYDRRGSELFERITELPEYYPTRTEAGILRETADRLAAIVPPGGALVELGSGASVKTRTLLSAGPHIGTYVPIDISEAFLLATAADLRRRYPDLSVAPVVADFTGPVDLPEGVRDAPKVGFFPGSTIGNLDPADAVALLARVRSWTGVEGFILGADLVKAEADLVAAYDDSQGVTAAFNLNILRRLNDEADADFDLDAFRHEARWRTDPARIEMHLVSTRAQTVTLGRRCFDFAEGESIHTESCRKYTASTLEGLARTAGWAIEAMLTDADERFAVAILRPA